VWSLDVTTIVHTTDLTGDDDAAFVHATALASASGARLVTLHGNPGSVPPSALPDAARLTARWGRPAIDQRRICHECCEDVAETLLDAIHRLSPDLVVTGTHARHGLAAVLHGSVAEAIARNLAVPTLIVPDDGRRVVDAATGTIALGRVHVASGDGPRVLDAARLLIRIAGSGELAIDGAPAAADVLVSVDPHVIRDAGRPVLAVPR
jgi:nucleotide-binding universal stress UspA family protein